MAIENMANQDFERAVIKAFWRKILSRLTGENNELLPFDVVRRRIPLEGQHSLGLQAVPIHQIVGSQGRYHDFDRAFLPIQKRTKDRWVNIRKAHYSQEQLPAIELYKMGDIYFVKDGNHRVSVARENGQDFIDAFVTEIDIPIPLTIDMGMDEIELKQAYAEFVEQTHLTTKHPEAQFMSTLPGQYEKLLEHIAVHRWYLGEQRHVEVPYEEAVESWYNNVYMPVISTLREQSVLKSFSGVSEIDLYLWLMEYQWYLREAYREESERGQDTKEAVAKRLVEENPIAPVKKMINVLKRADWIDELSLKQEWAAFNVETNLNFLRPEAKIETTLPGSYEKLLEHIAVHRWFLGERRGGEVAYAEAVVSWYDNVYYPLIKIIREQNILDKFKGRTEADLYLWIIEHQAYLREEYEDEIPIQKAAEQFAEDYSKLDDT